MTETATATNTDDEAFMYLPAPDAPRREPDTWQRLAGEVVQAGGVLEVTAGRLRDLMGVAKLGPIVGRGIVAALRNHQLSTVPLAIDADGYGNAQWSRHVPTLQGDSVVLYSTDTPVGQVLEAALGDNRGTLERLARGTGGVTDNRAAETLEMIRDMADAVLRK